MIRRLLALGLALAVVSAPVAMEMCQIACAAKGTQPSMPQAADSRAVRQDAAPAAHASCHEQSDSSLQLSPVDSACDHSGAATPSLVAGRSAALDLPLLTAVTSIDSIALVPVRGGLAARDSARSHPPGIPLAVPLRV